MVDGWQGKGENIHLFFGQLFHSAMEEYEVYRMGGMDHEASLREVVKNALKATWMPCPRCFGQGLVPSTHETDIECPSCHGNSYGPWTVDTSHKPGNYKNRSSLIRSIIGCLDHYNRGHDDPAETVQLEDNSPAVELSFRFDLDWGPNATFIREGETREGAYRQPYILCGHLDRVVNYQDQKFVVDYKTTTTTPSDYYFDQYNPNNQMTLYTLAGGVVLDTHIKGIIINAVQLLLEKPDKFVRGITYRTQGQLDEWLRDLEWWLNQAEAYAEANYWPMNDTACDKFGGCKFRGICSKDPEVRERFLAASFVKLPVEERWNPLKPR